MKRTIDEELKKWRVDPRHKVLLVRGARQVGKTYSIRTLAQSFENLLEVNFEEHEDVKTFFNGPLSPEGILEKLTAYFGVQVHQGKTLLFFDEVQACPNCLRSLRFFYEKMPGLYVAAAGSLLEFAITEIPSFGVGRISSLFMHPLSFSEFLQAIGMEQLAALISGSSTKNPIDPVLHRKILDHLRVYCAIGGMPVVVEHYRNSRDLRKCQQTLDEIILGLRDDFSKYHKRISPQRLNEVFESAALQAGCKFKYATVNPDSTHNELKKALELLVRAGLVYRIFHTDARGVPLGAQVNPRRFKVLLFDIGIYQRLVHLDIPAYLVSGDAALINKGPVAELFCGLEWVANSPTHRQPQLFYWHREARNSNAEVDYVIQQGNAVVPVEVKAGVRGAMQSMRLFLTERNLQRGIRVSHENYSSYGAIETVPLYAAGNMAETA
ncbi:MAG: DUF4143 domain-containing protein [Desulfobacteraceae bacterium]|nr:MAG: DUF4143 domain-containing protein [Desulfobacteraceae bacterium]